VDLWRKLGCASAFLVWLVVSFPFLFALAWSGAHCDPVPQCQRANELRFGLILAGVAVLAGLTGFVVAWALSSLASRRQDEGASAGFFALAILTALATAAIVIVAAYAVFDRVTA
jgi:hypothetical protein